MMKNFGRTALAAALAFATFAAGTTAQARDRHHGRGGGDDAAIAIGAGLVGLAVGAAIASDGRRDRRHYRDDYYYYDDRPRYRSHYYYDRPPRHVRKHWRKHHRRWHDDYGYRGDHHWRGERRWREERRYRDYRW